MGGPALVPPVAFSVPVGKICLTTSVDVSMSVDVANGEVRMQNEKRLIVQVEVRVIVENQSADGPRPGLARTVPAETAASPTSSWAPIIPLRRAA